MRKLTIGLCALALSGGPLVAPPAALAGDDDLTLTGTVTDFDRTDRGDRGPSEGDAWSVRFDLTDDGDDAGTGVSRCVLTDVDRSEHEFTARCFKALDLGDGKIRAAGTVTQDDLKDGEVSLPITGGTGDYEDAHGEITTELKGHGGPRQHRPGGPQGQRGHGEDREFTLTVDLH